MRETLKVQKMKKVEKNVIEISEKDLLRKNPERFALIHNKLVPPSKKGRY